MAEMASQMGEHGIRALQNIRVVAESAANGVELNLAVSGSLAAADPIHQCPGLDAGIPGHT
jgi:hypothetical protein